MLNCVKLRGFFRWLGIIKPKRWMYFVFKVPVININKAGFGLVVAAAFWAPYYKIAFYLFNNRPRTAILTWFAKNIFLNCNEVGHIDKISWITIVVYTYVFLIAAVLA